MDDDDDFDSFTKQFDKFALPPSMMKNGSKSDSIQLSLTTPTTTINSSVQQQIEEKIVSDIVLNIRLKFDYDQLKEFVDELNQANPKIVVNERNYSIFELYTFYTTSEPIDMTNQKFRKIYRPSLFIRKADAFGAWNFSFLLGLFDLEYECFDKKNNNEFPPVWKTIFDTNIKVNIIHLSQQSTSEKPEESNEPATTLLDILKSICRENKYDENDALKWLTNLKDENINTVAHLRTITNDAWEKLTRLTYVVKQMIRDYLQLNTGSNIFNQSKVDPYKESKATLFGDIHRVRRYFYYVTKHLHLTSYLDRRAVDIAIDEVRKAYDDDGNILINIKNYLRTFCLKNTMDNAKTIQQKRQDWINELAQLNADTQKLQIEVNKHQLNLQTAKTNFKYSENHYKIIIDKEQDTKEKVKAKLKSIENLNNNLYPNLNWANDFDSANKMKFTYQEEKRNAERTLEYNRNEFKKQNDIDLDLKTKIENYKSQIECLENFLKLNLEDEHKKLSVKYGRGLLLYGPPGTGKSELLKRVAIYAGITMVTQPLAAGELNRPYVGETEKLLIDIMYRANTIPYLICAMTIDEIDGLVPKRDNNAQQSKVDGISVLLSHIEGVKNIPNLIMFGATNRRNMMDEAFLRRMQAKVFVGRPSPKIREKMLQPLVTKDSKIFTAKRMDFLVKITTNFSGAAVGALKSSIIVAMEDDSNITDSTLLVLADVAAREFNVWFGISTLPEICRLNPLMFNSQEQDNYSLSLPNLIPTGRILVDNQDRKCFIELKDDATLEKNLDEHETSVLPLLARFVHGCSTRNIDTIQIIDLNFLTQQNAFDENQIFELLTTTFLECNQYNRSMLIFDIDSLVMLSISDSNMSQSKSISNIRLYQFIREKCKTTFVEQKQKNSNELAVEKWIVIIVKDPLLKSLLIDDIEFKKTSLQLKQKEDEEEKRKDDETVKKCPKCLQNYVPVKANYGDCCYHDGFVYDLDTQQQLTSDKAREKIQQIKLQNKKQSQQQQLSQTHSAIKLEVNLIWSCCLELADDHISASGCQRGTHGLPDELQSLDLTNKDPIAVVQEHFIKNQVAAKKLDSFLKNQKQLPINKPPIASAVGNRFVGNKYISSER
ncbi:unnamed protein product [Adineta steineri]|uniref:AAA+ ATPase domain-containing protein n=1 Tax=Adineta steineri TaxID=433720 RepID=A0A814HTU6_9BILA|nr:unnamed protein product [Adineta steineri]CAF4015063.1 unnamed protein product [Adineta steineri]